MTHEELARVLEETVESAHQWLANLPEPTVRQRPAEDRWSIAEVMGHLIDSANNNHQRFIRAQENDRLTFPKYEQNSWVIKNDYQHADWSRLIDLWRLYNLHLAHVIRHISADHLQTPCTIVPLEACTLDFLVTDYVDHLKHHLAKIEDRTGKGG